MHPPLYAVCAADTSVQDLLTGPDGLLRLYPFGEARQQEIYPYAVWSVVGGQPENYLGDRPNVDSASTQVDVYARSWSSAREVYAALRDAIEGAAYVSAFNGEMRDPETKSYRVSFTVDWITNR
jgi:hypothetical protein